MRALTEMAKWDSTLVPTESTIALYLVLKGLVGPQGKVSKPMMLEWWPRPTFDVLQSFMLLS